MGVVIIEGATIARTIGRTFALATTVTAAGAVVGDGGAELLHK